MMEPSQVETFLNIALIFSSLSLIFCVILGVALFMIVRSHAEKIGLLSHVAGHYLNAMEQQETAKKLVSTRKTTGSRSVSRAFLERSAR